MEIRLSTLAPTALLLATTLGCSQWQPLFNGRDLTGWEAVGDAKWVVEDGILIGTQGDNYAPGDLFTKETFSDFELKTTYRVDWPANTGIWFRYQTDKKAYQADILDWPDPVAYSGTIYCPGKMFLAVNADKGLENRDGWNDLRIRAEGDHLQVWLNGQQTADVHDDSTASGKIGIQVHPGEQFGPMKVMIKEVLLRPIASRH